MGQGYCDVSDCPPKARSVINRETMELARLSSLKAKHRKKDRDDKEKIKKENKSV